MDTIEIKRDEYAELQKRPTQDDLASVTKRAEDAEEAKAQADRDLEAAEAKVTAAEEAKAEAERERDALKAEKDAADLSADRMGKLGAGFVAKLGEKTKANLTKDSREMSDEAWEARLEELSEAYGVKHDEGASEEESAEGEFSREEVASAHLGGEGEGAKGASPQERKSIFGGLLKA